jgi:hypothetical protein
MYAQRFASCIMMSLGLTLGAGCYGGGATEATAGQAAQDLSADGSSLFGAAVSTACGASGVNAAFDSLSLTRRVIVDDIAEYSFNVRVGTGPNDVVMLHRVVRESAA